MTPTSAPAATQTVAVPTGDVAIAHGRDVFTKNCAACHGETRDKVLDAKLADTQWLQQQGDDVLAQTIANGKGIMPSWGKAKGGPLSNDDIGAIVAYLKAAAQGGADGAPVASVPTPTEIALTGDAAQGRDVYAKNCQVCHGTTRDKIASAKLADAAWLKQRGDSALSNVIANGKGGMPALGIDKGGPLNPNDIAVLLAYLKTVAN